MADLRIRRREAALSPIGHRHDEAAEEEGHQDCDGDGNRGRVLSGGWHPHIHRSGDSLALTLGHSRVENVRLALRRNGARQNATFCTLGHNLAICRCSKFEMQSVGEKNYHPFGRLSPPQKPEISQSVQTVWVDPFPRTPKKPWIRCVNPQTCADPSARASEGNLWKGGRQRRVPTPLSYNAGMLQPDKQRPSPIVGAPLPSFL